jgi:hypothetical protein
MMKGRQNRNRGKLTRSLAGYYAFEVSGTLGTDSLGATTLTTSGATHLSTGLLASGTHYTRASNQFLYAPATGTYAFTGDTPFTIDGWVYFDTVGTAQSIWSKSNGTGNQRGYNLVKFTSDAFLWQISSGGTAFVTLTSTAPAIVTGTWYFVRTWYDPSRSIMGIAVNETYFDTRAMTGGAFDNTQLFELGRNAVSSNALDGRLDEVGLWSRVLGTREALWLYNNGVGRTYPFN